jgi:hypothetical protein
MTKCPYVPPHPWNLDFPHLMLRAKAVRFKNGGVPLRDRILDETDGLGQFAGIPIVTQAVNAVNRSRAMRGLMEKTLGVDRNAWVPEYASQTLASAAPESGPASARRVRSRSSAPAIAATTSRGSRSIS